MGLTVMGANLELIRATYEGSSSEENGRNLLGYSGTLRWCRRSGWRSR